MGIVKKETAEAIVYAWLANAFFGALNCDGLPMYPFMGRVRRFVARTNKMASDALWDGKPNLAYSLLKKHGFGDDLVIDNEEEKERRRERRAHKISEVSHMVMRARKNYYKKTVGMAHGMARQKRYK